MTIKDLSEAASMNYNTVRKYYLTLKEMNLINKPDNSLVPILHRILSLTQGGKTVKEAIKIIYDKKDQDDNIAMKAQVEQLQNEVNALKYMLQNFLPALQGNVQDTKKQGGAYVIEENKEEKGFFYHMKMAFKSIFKRNKTKE
jgi:DNA-binding transcriptional regulator YhcF (GntR family)